MLAPTEADRLAARERPRGRPILYQRWEQLLFLHWAREPAEIQRTLPPGLFVDTFQGRAWLGVTPFLMRGVRPALCPAVPGISNFLELNLRTYVFDSQGRPGVWFYSLDANQWLAVVLARIWYRLPYEHARMTAQAGEGEGEIDYRSQRAGQARETRFRYRPSAPADAAEASLGTLEFFLVERYRLFTRCASSDLLFTCRVWHSPYRIGSATVALWDDEVPQLAGFACDRPPDHVCSAASVAVDVFPAEPVAEAVRDAVIDGESLAGNPLPA